MRKLFSSTRALQALAACLLAATAFAADGKFDHFTTGFPLSGGHAQVDCASCHVGGMFRGTPDRCVACHGPGGFVSASTKTQNHILSSNRCETCHTPVRWNIGIRTDHGAVTGSCISCHNGIRAQGKTANHVASSNDCVTCHNTVTWRNARFDHSRVSSACFSCHNGTTATGKNPGHVSSSNLCSDCHSTRGWRPARFDHNGIAAGTCSTCHNGVDATGKGASHIVTSLQCDTCHTTTAWRPAHFSHTGVTGSCSSCHNGTSATGKSGSHFVTARQCDTCHTTAAWTPAPYSHSGYYPNHGTRLDCTSCHKGNGEAITGFAYWGTYPRTCAGCHAGDYSTREHKGTPVANNSDCGRCHSTRDWDR